MGYIADVWFNDVVNKYSHITKDFEGLRLKPYRCSAGRLTIGYGRNLEDVGITQGEAEWFFATDFLKAMTDAADLLKDYVCDYHDLNTAAFYVVTDMVYNMGKSGVKQFKTMLTALSKQDYRAAADAMVSSKWYSQVGRRSKKLVEIMRSC